ncbi:mannose-1-phosphate guanylyltransferase [Nostoc cf. commune SO-36]|uniref:Mannose-1-phosphate guanylyltransferase n=1 Tax=Nostoc cf. commune SO-36 TaxID=449208 RepID=A0ABN6Q7Z3_NOSCO|nr:mannose-1-phosphate guanylyltransferase [Nostoc cf. commune SO-36]
MKTFLVISGDSITDFDLTAAIAFHKQNKSKATLILTRVPNPIEFGVVITDQEGRISRFLEKPSSSEIFSDTVNTGTYILEPEVLEYLPANIECDFSKDLFPLLLAKDEPMYGYIAQGYWCDVGHLDAYRQAQYDALDGKVQLDYAYKQVSHELWVGQNTYIDQTAVIETPVVIGDNCRIGARVQIEAGTVIGDNVTIGADANLKRPIVWNGAFIGEEVALSACVISRGTRVDRRAQVLEAAVVGSLSTVGEEAQISPGVRVWPSKKIESGAVLNINLIWGNTAQRNLFGQRGVQGLANIDITPEFAVKLGSAYGSTLKPGSKVTVSRDQRNVSRMVTRSLIAGLMSVGIDIQNLDATAIPIARTVIPTMSVAGGIHVRVHPDRPDYILVEFMDAKGINITKALEKKIEGAYFKEDMRRALIHEIGDVSYPSQVMDRYCTAFEKLLHVHTLRNSRAKVVIDYVYAVSGAVLPQMLDKFGADAVVLNASVNKSAMSITDREGLLTQLGHVVEALKANFGVQVSANGEQLILVDESGYPIRGETLTALMVDMILTANPRGTVVVPVHASSAIEQVARRHDGRVIRTKANPTALMEACQKNSNVVLGGSGETGFIFPQLHPGFDAMFCIAKIIEMLTIQERSLAAGAIGIAPCNSQNLYNTLPVDCQRCFDALPWWKLTHAQNLELIDGVKICQPYDDSWLLVLPDASEPLVHLYANSNDREWVDETVRNYRTRVQTFVERQQEYQPAEV